MTQKNGSGIIVLKFGGVYSRGICYIDIKIREKIVDDPDRRKEVMAMNLLRTVPMDRASRRRFTLWRGREPNRPRSVMAGLAAQHRRFPLKEPLLAALAASGHCGTPPDTRGARGAPARAVPLSFWNRERGIKAAK